MSTPIPANLGARYAHQPSDRLEVHERGRDFCLLSIRKVVESHGHEFHLRAVFVETTNEHGSEGLASTTFRYDPKRHNDEIRAAFGDTDQSMFLVGGEDS